MKITVAQIVQTYLPSGTLKRLAFRGEITQRQGEDFLAYWYADAVVTPDPVSFSQEEDAFDYLVGEAKAWKVEAERKKERLTR